VSVAPDCLFDGAPSHDADDVYGVPSGASSNQAGTEARLDVYWRRPILRENYNDISEARHAVRRLKDGACGHHHARLHLAWVRVELVHGVLGAQPRHGAACRLVLLPQMFLGQARQGVLYPHLLQKAMHNELLVVTLHHHEEAHHVESP
jgi:hypothetical protein